MINFKDFNSPKIVSKSELFQILKKRNSSTILLKGAYDILHSGHVFSFINAKNIGDILIVCIYTDEAIKKKKGNNRPFNKLTERTLGLSSIEYIDFIIPIDDLSPFKIINEIRPVFFGASHFSFFNDIELEQIKTITNLIEIPKIGGNSTTKIISNMNNTNLSSERKLNLHLSIDDKTASFVKSINEDIINITNSEIDFSANNNLMIPHITIVMGYLDEYKHKLKELIEEFSLLFRDVEAIPYSLSAPYIENYKNNYVFCDVELGDGFRKLQDKIFNQFVPDILIVQTDFNKQAHLTLGNINNNQVLVKNMLSSKYGKFHQNGLATSFELSDVGKKGTCINSLWNYDIQ